MKCDVCNEEYLQTDCLDRGIVLPNTSWNIKYVDLET